MLLNLCAVQDSNPQPLDSYPLDHGRRPRDLEDHFMAYIQMVMTAGKDTKLGHDHVTRLAACFVFVLLTIFQLYFLHKRWQ